MGVYGNEILLNEAMFFSPPEGKKFKKEVNEKLKEMRRSIFNKDMLTKYNQNDINDVKNFLKTKYNKFMMSPIITLETYANGVTTIDYYKGTFGSLDNGYMYFRCFFNYRGANATYYSYIEKSKCIIPEDVVNKAIELCDDKAELLLTKNKITVKDYIYQKNNISNEIYDKISEYALSKYSNELNVAKSFGGALSFRKK